MMLICFINILIAEFQCNSLVLPCVLLYAFKSITLRGAHQPHQTTKESMMQKRGRAYVQKEAWAQQGKIVSGKMEKIDDFRNLIQKRRYLTGKIPHKRRTEPSGNSSSENPENIKQLLVPGYNKEINTHFWKYLRQKNPKQQLYSKSLKRQQCR